MKDLLIKWAELEPERCLERRAGFSLTVEGSSIAPYVLKSQEADSEDLMRIQYTVQKAIVVRGWDYRLEAYAMEGQRQYVAWVYPGGQALGQATEAEALLSAYVKALEAQGERSEGV